ncbi:hypothetical protein DSM101010T_26050 [Desulfovibrio subterraneus]|uniref:Uncharacterized protein n=1 Tax=Desulfovibrio subterraneus TaxID=2718620 RepID=A0A7J0BKP2_9BACT|nr:hypothetical protein DSM101010T_26050 [Desulfovibrio subterraneus]
MTGIDAGLACTGFRSAQWQPEIRKGIWPVCNCRNRTAPLRVAVTRKKGARGALSNPKESDCKPGFVPFAGGLSFV